MTLLFQTSITNTDALVNNIRCQLGEYVTFATGKNGKSSVILFSGSSLEATYGYLLAQASDSRFNQFFDSDQISYQRLPAISSELWYCICLPLRRQRSFYSTGFSCCTKFKFQYNGLYCTVELASAPKLTQYPVLFTLRSPVKVREVIFHMTRREKAMVYERRRVTSNINRMTGANVQFNTHSKYN